MLRNLGYDAEIIYLKDLDNAFRIASDAFGAKPYDAIMIGAGVRKDDKMFILFEQLVNAAHQAAPNAKICFNSNPMDTTAAIQRWVKLQQN